MVMWKPFTITVWAPNGILTMKIQGPIDPDDLFNGVDGSFGFREGVKDVEKKPIKPVYIVDRTHG